MKCLFCGKELAIFKRLSGSEFCSDAHRKQYQQEYNQLALSRLMNAPDTPPAEALPLPKIKNTEEKAAGKNAEKSAVSVTSGKAKANEKPTAASNTTSVKRAIEAQAATIVTAPPAAPAEKLPPFAALVDCKPAPRVAVTPSQAAIAVDLLEVSFPPVHPEKNTAEPSSVLDHAAQIPFATGVISPRTAAIHIEGQSEPRDFGLPAPFVEVPFTRVLPVLRHPQQPFPVNAALCQPSPAQLWSAEASRWERVPELVRGTFVDCDLQAADWELPALVASLESESVAEQPAPSVAPAIVSKAPVAAADSAIAPTKPEPLSLLADKIGPLVIDINIFGATPSQTKVDAVSTPVTTPQPANVVTQTIPPKAAAPAPITTAPPQETAAPEPPRPSEVPAAIEKAMPIAPRMIAANVAKPVQAFVGAPAVSPASVLPEFQALPLRPKMAVVPSRPTDATPAEAKKSERAGSSIFDKSVAKAPTLTATQAAIQAANQPSGATPAAAASQPAKPNGQAPKAATAKKADPPVQGAKNGSAKPVTQPAAKTLPEKTAADKAAANQQEKPAEKIWPPQSAGTATNEFPPLSGIKPVDTLFGSRDLNLPELHLATQKPVNRTTLFMAAGAALVVVLAVVAFYAFPMKGTVSSASASISAASISRDAIGTGPDWIENFSPDALHPRTISILKSTSAYKDYRIEMEAQIDQKALGWVFRAKDAKNFLVGKIELQPAGISLNPTLVHYAVVNGVAEPRKQVPLGMVASAKTVYRLRVEASGNRFTAYVQDRKVDEWTDPRFPSGGAGLYSDKGERAILQSAFDVTPVTKTN